MCDGPAVGCGSALLATPLPIHHALPMTPPPPSPPLPPLPVPRPFLQPFNTPVDVDSAWATSLVHASPARPSRRKTPSSRHGRASAKARMVRGCGTCLRRRNGETRTVDRARGIDDSRHSMRSGGMSSLPDRPARGMKGPRESSAGPRWPSRTSTHLFSREALTL